MTSTIDRVVLEFHDCAGTERIISLQITGESWHGRHDNDHLILLAVACSANNTLNNGSSDFVGDGSLGVHGRSDEELVLDIDEVLAVFDDINVGVGDRVLEDMIS